MRYAVEWVSGYLGCGVNSYEREYCESKDAAERRADELRAKNYCGVKVIKTA